MTHSTPILFCASRAQLYCIVLLFLLGSCTRETPKELPAPTPTPPLINNPPIKELLLQAQPLAQRGAHREAGALFKQIITHAPEHIAAYEGLALAQLRDDQLQQAAQTCSSGLARDSTVISLYNMLSAAYAGRGRHKLAISALEKAVALRPDFALGHTNLGVLYTRLGQYAQAEHYLAKAQQLNRHDPVLQRRYGELLLKTAKVDSALSEFAAALKALINAGNASMLLQNPAAAVSYYDRATQHVPKAAIVWLQLARAHQALQQSNLAIASLQKGLKIPNAPPCTALHVRSFATTGKRSPIKQTVYRHTGETVDDNPQATRHVMTED